MKQIDNYILEKLYIGKGFKVDKWKIDNTSASFKDDVQNLLGAFLHDMSIPNKYQIKYSNKQANVFFKNAPIQFRDFRDKLNKFCLDVLDLGIYKSIDKFRIPPVNPGKYMIVLYETDK